MESFLVLILVIVVLVVIGAIAQSVITSGKKDAMDGVLGKLEDFNATQKVMASDGNTGIAIDEDRKKVCLITYRSDAVNTRLFDYKGLLSSEIFEDGETVTKTVRSSQLGGTLIGGLALGGIGAIIGGLSGKTKTSGTVKRVDLRLTVNSTQNPLHDVNFLNISAGVKKDGIVYQTAINQARHWHGLVAVLIKRAEMEDKANEVDVKPQAVPSANSLADELKKLAELRDSGILTAEEFHQQKARLLAT